MLIKYPHVTSQACYNCVSLSPNYQPYPILSMSMGSPNLSYEHNSITKLYFDIFPHYLKLRVEMSMPVYDYGTSIKFTKKIINLEMHACR